MHIQIFNRFLLVLSFALLTSCGSEPVEDLNETERQLYESAQGSLRSGNYQAAVQKLQHLEARFPFGRFAEQAQLEIIYAYYKSRQSQAARAAADRFIRLHPQHPQVDYAIYLRGLASFEEDQSFLSQFIPMDPAKRDPGAARDAFNDFARLIRQYPDSQYAPDAQKRMIYLRNLLAEHEVNVARYYIRRGAYIAAANRGRYVFENYQEAPSVPNALAIMVQAYRLLDMNELADNALAVLKENFPDHQSLNSSGKFTGMVAAASEDRSWLNIISFGWLDN